MGEGSLHPQPKGWGIRDPPHSRCIKVIRLHQPLLKILIIEEGIVVTIGKMERVPLREVWEHEEQDFTPWLQNNIDVLNEVLKDEETNLYLSDPEREQVTENFHVDIVAEDERGNTVIIENQLEKSNHDHLGKLITYLAATEAKAAIWIVSDPRQEHADAISWLNKSQLAAFYLLKLEAYTIENSSPAPLLTLIVKPGPRIINNDDPRFLFWTSLLERMKMKSGLFANISPQSSIWISTGAGKYGLSYQFVIHKHDVQALFGINRAKEETKEIFESLAVHKEEINSKFMGELDWQPSPELKSSKIVNYINIGGYLDEEKWSQIQDGMIDAMIRLEKALRPYIDNL